MFAFKTLQIISFAQKDIFLTLYYSKKNAKNKIRLKAFICISAVLIIILHDVIQSSDFFSFSPKKILLNQLTWTLSALLSVPKLSLKM